MQKTKELMEVPGFEGKKIVVKRLNSGEQSDVRDYALEIKVGQVDAQNRKPEINTGLSIGKLKHYGLAVGIEEAPFFVENNQPISDIERRYKILRTLESETTDYLNEQLNDLNQLKIKEEIAKK